MGDEALHRTADIDMMFRSELVNMLRCPKILEKVVPAGGSRAGVTVFRANVELSTKRFPARSRSLLPTS